MWRRGIGGVQLVKWGIKGFNKVWWHIKAVRTEVVVFRIISFHSMPFEAGPILCMLASARRSSVQEIERPPVPGRLKTGLLTCRRRPFRLLALSAMCLPSRQKSGAAECVRQGGKGMPIAPGKRGRKGLCERRFWGCSLLA